MATEDMRTKAAALLVLQHAAAKLGKTTEGLEDVASKLVSAKDVSHEVRVDRRFPNQNQVNNCWTAFNEYQLCVEKRGRTDASCIQRGRDYSTLCPQKWVEEWKEQSDSGKGMSVGKAFAGAGSE